jgi:hypothetical protein
MLRLIKTYGCKKTVDDNIIKVRRYFIYFCLDQYLICGVYITFCKTLFAKQKIICKNRAIELMRDCLYYKEHLFLF